MPTYKANEPKKAAIYFVDRGVYEVEIRKAIEKVSTRSGNQMIKLTCTIIMPDGNDGPEIWEHLTFTEKAAWKIDQVLAAVEIAIVAGEDIDVEPEQLIGKKGVCQIGKEAGAENPDHRFNKIERWFFGEEKKAWLSGNRQVAATKVQPKPQPKPAAPSLDEADEIPF